MQGNGAYVVTGAFGYTGKYIARRLLRLGKQVRTLTGHPERHAAIEGNIPAAPFNFDKPDALVESLRGADVLINTYWVRYIHGDTTFDQAVENSAILFRAAAEAGVRRIVHVSVSNPSLDSPLPYFSGKTRTEQALKEAGPSYAIVRPTLIYGKEDILINNIAWMLRAFPIIAVPGSGAYRLQPVYVEDLAAIAADAAQREGNETLDAAGPEILSFEEMVRAIAAAVGRKARIIHLSPRIALSLCGIIGSMVGDLVLTRTEVDGLMADLLVSANPPTATSKLTDWLRDHKDTVGSRYASEMKRHYSKV